MNKKTRMLELPVGETTLDEAEKRLVLATIERYDGDKLRAAVALGASMSFIYKKLRQYENRT